MEFQFEEAVEYLMLATNSHSSLFPLLCLFSDKQDDFEQCCNILRSELRLVFKLEGKAYDFILNLNISKSFLPYFVV